MMIQSQLLLQELQNMKSTLSPRGSFSVAAPARQVRRRVASEPSYDGGLDGVIGFRIKECSNVG